MASQAIPKMDPYHVARVSAIAALKDCQVAVVLNKCDLLPGLPEGMEGTAVAISARTGEGLPDLLAGGS